MQGCENEIIILDLTLTDPHSYNFMADYRRLNVLMSRARSSLIVVGGGQALLGTSWWPEMRQSLEGRDDRRANVDSDDDAVEYIENEIILDESNEWRVPPLVRLTDKFDTTNPYHSLKTHALNFRAFVNSAIDYGFPVSLVQGNCLFRSCPRHFDQTRRCTKLLYPLASEAAQPYFRREQQLFSPGKYST